MESIDMAPNGYINVCEWYVAKRLSIYIKEDMTSSRKLCKIQLENLKKNRQISDVQMTLQFPVICNNGNGIRWKCIDLPNEWVFNFSL